MPRPPNLKAQQYRDEAMLRLCQDLNQNRDQYRIPTRDARLAHLIATHDLQEIYNAGGRNEAHQRLTTRHFVALVQRAATKAGTTSTALYQDGPGVLSAAYRRQIAFDPPLPQPPVPGVAGASTASGSQRQNQTITTGTNGAHAHPLHPAGQASNTAFRSTTGVIRLDDETSEGSPAASLASKKRKFDGNDEPNANERQPKQARTALASSPAVPETTQSTASSPDSLNTSNKVPAPASGSLPTQHMSTAQAQGVTQSGSSVGKQPFTEMSNNAGVSGQSAGAASRKRDGDEVGLDQSTRMQKSPRLVEGTFKDVQKTSEDNVQPDTTGRRKRNVDDAVLETSDRAQKSRRLVKAAPLRSEVVKKPLPKLKDRVHIMGCGNASIEKEFRTIWSQTQNFAGRLVRDTEIDERAPAKWVMEPEADLEVLYETVLGKEWRGAARILNQLKLTAAQQVFEMITAAAMNELVLQQPLPWRGPDEDIAYFSETVDLYNDILYRQTGAVHLHIENVVWQVAREKVRTEEFYNETIEPLGRNLAEIFWQTLQPQLACLSAGDPKHADCGAEQWADERLKELTYIFSHALLVKGMMAAAPDHFSTHWVPFGVDYDDATMTRARPETVYAQVAWCISPLVKRRVFGNSEWERARSALVYTRKPPAPYVN